MFWVRNMELSLFKISECNLGVNCHSCSDQVFHFLLASIVFIIWTTMKFRIVTCQSVSYKYVQL